MIAHNRARLLLRRAALSAALILAAAPAALADPPGYLFQDFEQTVPSAPVPPHQIDPASQQAASPAVAGASGFDRTLSQSDQAQVKGGQPIRR
jgi:hypothetical protein